MRSLDRFLVFGSDCTVREAPEPECRSRMTAWRNSWPASDVHVEWGVPGIEQAVAHGDGVVVVDVMSFSTMVAMVTARGATVRGLGADDIAAMGGRDAVAERLGAHVAGETRGDNDARFTLSPSSAARRRRR